MVSYFPSFCTSYHSASYQYISLQYGFLPNPVNLNSHKKTDSNKSQLSYGTKESKLMPSIQEKSPTMLKTVGEIKSNYTFRILYLSNLSSEVINAVIIIQ